MHSGSSGALQYCCFRQVLSQGQDVNALPLSSRNEFDREEVIGMMIGRKSGNCDLEAAIDEMVAEHLRDVEPRVKSPGLADDFAVE
jgi:hypothetical protein